MTQPSHFHNFAISRKSINGNLRLLGYHLKSPSLTTTTGRLNHHAVTLARITPHLLMKKSIFLDTFTCTRIAGQTLRTCLFSRTITGLTGNFALDFYRFGATSLLYWLFEAYLDHAIQIPAVKNCFNVIWVRRVLRPKNVFSPETSLWLACPIFPRIEKLLIHVTVIFFVTTLAPLFGSTFTLCLLLWIFRFGLICVPIVADPLILRNVFVILSATRRINQRWIGKF